MYGQPGYVQPGYGQPVYSQPVYGQPVYGQQQFAQPVIMQQPMIVTTVPMPVFSQVACGKGIDPNEYNTIKQAATNIYMSGQMPRGEKTAYEIKRMLNGEWLVVTYPKDKHYDFSLTSVKGGDYLSFTLNETLYQVLRLK